MLCLHFIDVDDEPEFHAGLANDVGTQKTGETLESGIDVQILAIGQSIDDYSKRRCLEYCLEARFGSAQALGHAIETEAQSGEFVGTGFRRPNVPISGLQAGLRPCQQTYRTHDEAIEQDRQNQPR